ncbi:MAG: InlB B-repeat-containing protein [Clostridia bacterium]|nr:InlB B-repeat-containing protein [Clostridia bacterium]
MVTETVTMPNRIRIFGGGHNESVSGDTNLTVLGGSYNRIYGGGNGGGVGGNVNLTIGGNVNSGDGIDDKVTNPAISPCQVYGGSYNGTVSGNVTVNFGGNAVTRYLSANGAGTGAINGTATVNMTGGKATTVCGTRSYTMTDAKIFLNITGGLIESIFGGAESTNISGDVQIYLGANADVSRRVFGGCYNDTNIFSFKTSYHITGSITVLVDKGAKVGSGTGLSSANKLDMGLYGCSRYSSAFSDEICTLVFLNGNSSSNYKIGGAYTDRSDYKVTVGTGGTVKSAMNGTASLVMLPDEDKCAVIGSDKLADGQTYTLSASSTSITFTDIVKYDITLDANNGTDAVETLEKVEGIAIELPSTNAQNGDLEFIGWATSKDAKTPDYKAGDSYTADGNVTLYAVWRGKPQKYTVMHIVVDGDNSTAVKIETLDGYVYSKTNATALEMLGYNALPVVQETLKKNEATVIMVMYEKGGYALGDINCDGSVDPLDEAILARHLDGWADYDAFKLCDYTTDCNNDGTVDFNDCDYLAKHLAGWDGYTLN